jgi:hypothetical protein
MTIDAHQLTKRKVKLFLMTSKRLFKVKKEKETNDSALFFPLLWEKYLITCAVHVSQTANTAFRSIDFDIKKKMISQRLKDQFGLHIEQDNRKR